MMNLIDTHSHIYLQEFANDQPEIFERLNNEGVRMVLLPAIDASTHQQMLDLEARKNEVCLAMMGIHPCSIKENYKEELKIAGDYLAKRAFIAIGEIGLDFYWDKTFAEQQYIAFHEQIEWALQYDLPIVIHSRNSTNECINVVAEHKSDKLKGVFHCFSGDVEQAKKIIELGFYLGIGGVLTFKNAGLDRVVEEINLDHIVLETDAPYLAPVPFRGKRNEPSYLKYVVEKLSIIKNCTKEEVADITTANAKNLFRLKDQ